MLSLSIENSLNTNQFETIMGLIKQMMKSVEDEHKNKLQQMDSMKSQQEMALVSFNRSTININSQNILKSIDDQTNQAIDQIKGNTNVLVNNSNTNNVNNTGSVLKPNLNSMLNNSGRTNSNGQDNFFKDLTSSLGNNQKNSNLNRKEPDYSHLVNLNLNNKNSNKPNKFGQTSLDALQVFPNSQSNKPLNQMQSNQFPVGQFNQMHLNQQPANMINPTMLSIEHRPSSSSTNQYNKLNRSELDEFLN